MADFARFRALVFTDVALRDALWAQRERYAFVALAVRLGAERGCSFEATDVEAALAQGLLASLVTSSA
ncbi:MAG: hypothetical protein ABSD03_06375 [Vulcanimicrobiaceae bacterium]